MLRTAPIGEIKKGTKTNNWKKYIWLACYQCGKERWVDWVFSKKSSGLCHACAAKNNGKNNPRGEKSQNWRGGKRLNSNGYIQILLQPDDPMFPMADRRSHLAYEHRLIVARSLGRLLSKGEKIHHSNGIRTDNRLVNLQFLAAYERHTPFTRLKLRIEELERKVKELQRQIDGCEI